MSNLIKNNQGDYRNYSRISSQALYMAGESFEPEKEDLSTEASKRKYAGAKGLKWAGTASTVALNPAVLGATGGLSALAVPAAAIAGGAYSYFNADKIIEENNKIKKRNYDRRISAGLDEYNSLVSQGYSSKGNSLAGFRYGGKLKRYSKGGFIPEYEVEKGEVIKGTDVKVSDGKRISSNFVKVEGKNHGEYNPKTGGEGTHASGGIQVLSDKTKISPELFFTLKSMGLRYNQNSSHAEVVENLAKKIIKFEQQEATNKNSITNNTAKMMKFRLNMLSELVFQDQELQKNINNLDNTTSTMKGLMTMRYGGNLPKYKTGFNLDTKPSKKPSKSIEIHPEEMEQFDSYMYELNKLNPNFKKDDATYDYYSAFQSNLKPTKQPDGTWHLPSIDPNTGKVLKRKNNSSYNLMLDEEKKLGNKIITKDDVEYSVPKNKFDKGIDYISNRLDKTNPDDYYGTLLNTTMLAKNLSDVKKQKIDYELELPSYTRMNYASSTSAGLNKNSKDIRNAMLLAKRYTPNANLSAILSAGLEANNQLITQENINRNNFNNQIASMDNSIKVARAGMISQYNKERTALLNARKSLSNRALQVYVQGEMENKSFRDRLKLDKETAEIYSRNRYGNVGDYDNIYELAKTPSEFKKVYLSTTDATKKARMIKVAKAEGIELN